MMALNTFDHQEIFQTARQLPITIYDSFFAVGNVDAIIA